MIEDKTNKKTPHRIIGKGSKPSTGNISDNQIHLILGLPKQTMCDWKKSNSYKKTLYWFLKTMTKEEVLERKELAEILIKE